MCYTSGGSNLGPSYHHCSGWENHHLGGFVLVAIIGAVMYFGKESLPDILSECVVGVEGYFKQFLDCFTALF